MDTIITTLGWFFAGFLVGLFSFIGYVAFRALGSAGWDDSNVLNVLRLIFHVAAHPEDFPKMYYLTRPQWLECGGEHLLSRPFHYLGDDEFETVVDSRPPR